MFETVQWNQLPLNKMVYFDEFMESGDLNDICPK